MLKIKEIVGIKAVGGIAVICEQNSEIKRAICKDKRIVIKN